MVWTNPEAHSSVMMKMETLISLNYYPESYLLLFKYFPLSCTILNIQKINAAESIYFSYYIISIVYSILITVITFIVFQNKI